MPAKLPAEHRPWLGIKRLDGSGLRNAQPGQKLMRKPAVSALAPAGDSSRALRSAVAL